MNTTTAGVRPHAGANGRRRHPLRGTLRAIARLVGRDRRACWCPRCVVTRTGIYRRSRFQTDRRIEIETRVFGILVRRRITPLTSGS